MESEMQNPFFRTVSVPDSTRAIMRKKILSSMAKERAHGSLLESYRIEYGPVAVVGTPNKTECPATKIAATVHSLLSKTASGDIVMLCAAANGGKTDIVISSGNRFSRYSGTLAIKEFVADFKDFS